MNLLKDEKFKDLLNYPFTFDEKVVELAKIFSQFEQGGDLGERMDVAFHFLVAMRDYLNSRRDLNSLKISLDHLTSQNEQQGKDRDERFQQHFQNCEQTYYRASDEFVERNYQLKQRIEAVLAILNSERDGAAAPPDDSDLWGRFDDLRSSWSEYPRFAGDAAPADIGASEASELQSRLDALELEKSALESEKAAAEARAAELEEALPDPEEFETLKQQAAQADLLRQEIETLQSAGASDERLEALEQKVAEADARADQADAARREADDHLAAARTQLEQAEGDRVLMETLQAERDELQARIADLEEQLATATARPAPVAEDLTAQRDEQIASLTESLARRDRELEQMAAARDAAQTELADWKRASFERGEEVAKLEKSIARQKKAREKAEDEVDLLKASGKVAVDLTDELEMLSKLQLNLKREHRKAAQAKKLSKNSGGNSHAPGSKKVARKTAKGKSAKKVGAKTHK